MLHMMTRNNTDFDKTETAWKLHSRRFLFSLALALAAILLADIHFASARRAVDTRILLLGNSFTKGLKPQLKSLIRSSGANPLIKSLAKSGATLAYHAGSSASRSRIASQPWDHVVLQEQSLGMFELRFPSARVLDAYVAANGSRTAFFMTWRDREDPLVAYDSLRGVPGGDMGYVPIATELAAPLAPVGWAFRKVVIDRVGINLWSKDGHHASNSGRYLTVCVIYASLFGKSPEGLWAPGSVEPADAAYLQSVAADTVFSEAEVWNVDVAPPPDPSVQVLVSSGGDDAVENTATGSVKLSGSLAFGDDTLAALRFRNVSIPQGATVLSAHLQVASGSGRTNPVTLEYRAAACDCSVELGSQAGALSSLATGSAAVIEAPPPYESGQYNSSADLAPVVQEILDRPGWTSGNALTILVSDLGSSRTRTVKSYDVRASSAPALVIEYLP